MKKQENGKFKTSIGGQALIEGVMMRGPHKIAMSVRTPDGIVTEVEDYVAPKEKHKIWGVPFIRGIIGFGSSMKIGVKSLLRSADLAVEGTDDGEEPSKFDKWLDRHFSKKTIDTMITTVALVFGIAIPIVLFFLLPSFIAGLFGKWLGTGILRSLVEGAIRIAIFILYLFLVSLMKDMKRTFAYHGAEHKSIYCYEAGLDLTVENVRVQRRQHPRCGTSFLFVVIIISILVTSLLGFANISNPLARAGLRLALLPVIVAISYEFNMWAGRHDNIVSRVLRAPGMWLQNLTTNEPDDSMIEVAIASLKAVIPEVEGEDRW